MRKPRTSKNDPMRIAPGLTIERINSTPCIYTVICEGSGNRYIGQSVQAATRRNVHKYWLKHVMRYNGANVFFGNDDVENDVKTHGLESFYFDILECTPIDETEAERKIREERWIASFDPETVYNKDDYKTNPLFKFEPELVRLTELTKSLETNLADVDARIKFEANPDIRRGLRKNSRLHRTEIKNARTIFRKILSETKTRMSKFTEV